MNVTEATMWGQQALLMVGYISGPVLIATLTVGVIISLVQAVTQVHEMTLVFVPKIIVVGAVLLWMGPWMLDQMVSFGQLCFQSTADLEE
jgi:flagellar biosynthesis protein FliQ